MTGTADYRTAPFPTVTLGAGRWRRIITLLERSGTKADAQLADQLRRYITLSANDGSVT